MSAMDLHPEQTEPSGKRLQSGAWRDEVKSRATRLRSEARSLRVPPERQEAIKVEIFDPLDRVDELANRPARLREWLSGALVEECWRLLRQAEEGILRFVPDQDMRVSAEAAVAHGEKHLGRDDALVRSLQNYLDDQTSSPDTLRTAAVRMLGVSHEQSDGRHRQMRQFRNQLLGMSVALVVLAGLALLGQFLINDDRLIPGPSDAEVSPTITLGLVIFAGYIGALFSAIPSWSQIPQTQSPFNMARQQAYLKIATGGWSAIIGLLVVNAGLAGGGAPDGETSLGGLAILAALFGAGQEAVTRFADNKAGNILGSP